MSSTISDEELIEELRRYGEKNLPTLPSKSSPSARSKKSAGTQLNDSNRDIYLKKLNHYRAREKAESNPSKQYQKQSQTGNSNVTIVKQQPIEYDSILTSMSNGNRRSTAGRKSNGAKNVSFSEDNDGGDRDVIPLNETSEYVQVSNAYTSPLSLSTHNAEATLNGRSNSSGGPSSGGYATRSAAAVESTLGYARLKERIELDRTLSKYRSEINDIINGSLVRNRHVEPGPMQSKYAKTATAEPPPQSDVIYAGTYGNHKDAVSATTKTLYCPKPEPNKSYVKIPGVYGLRRRSSGDFIKRESELGEITGISYVGKIGELFRSLFGKVTPLISDLGLQFAKILPYIVLIVFTIIIMQYIHMKFVNDPMPLLPGKSKSADRPPNPVHNYCDEIKDVQCSQTKKLVRELIDYLRSVAGQVECAAGSLSPLPTISLQFQPETSTIDVSPAGDVNFIDKCVHVSKIGKHLADDLRLIPVKEHRKIAMESVLSAIAKNPQWNLRLLNSNYTDAQQLDQVTYVMSTISSKPLLCRARELLHYLYVRVIMVTSILIALILAYLVYKAYTRRALERDHAFYNLVSQVTALVERNYEASLIDPVNIKPYIAISHIYDTLFAASERSKPTHKKLWANVVKFIRDHESRIHLATEFIDGEETHVWKWVVPKLIVPASPPKTPVNLEIGLANSTMIGSTEPKQPISNNIKHHDDQSQEQQQKRYDSETKSTTTTTAANNQNGWQGDAFSRSQRLANSPTPCLKIRNMFDSAEIRNDPKLQRRIHNDILERFNLNSNTFFKNASSSAAHLAAELANNSILHIACDLNSREGCVYVKCKSNEAAGRVYASLNGTWYNGKLLNVKFLRSDRYLERFPDSANHVDPLTPLQL